MALGLDADPAPTALVSTGQHRAGRDNAHVSSNFVCSGGPVPIVLALQQR